MLSSLRRPLPRLGRRWKPLNFSNPNFVRIPEYHKIEEETLPDYIASCYYSTRIGAVSSRRQIGIWIYLNRMTCTRYNDSGRDYVILKIFIQASSLGQQIDHELNIYRLNIYRRIEQSPKDHPGRDAVRMLLDNFYIERPQDKH
ncbi:hypothetical protein NUU61_009130 [Penicillium alfredii]|uniref:Uncharacterized protein n=1 Tax=Penicillium alfredii TaxID=1506179 RepID=A0A9W9EMT9_9EURO|nr:uncharacterized protein NUU61_009130 [Penicillium alfredii]KAJ5084551.1 hypothetical protein NUU61_009130 [Penicillium alfredii]